MHTTIHNAIQYSYWISLAGAHDTINTDGDCTITTAIEASGSSRLVVGCHVTFDPEDASMIPR